MAKVFNNTNKNEFPSEQALSLEGWDKTPIYDKNRIPHIADTVGAGIALAKMGTSIPTPFARIFMFKTAFEMVNASPVGHDDNTAYGKLVSECLDFLEFIYLYGQDIEVKPWNVLNNINSLKNSPREGHNRLGMSLETFARDLDVSDIYLIYYKNTLIGGTSPFTLVYTSPNWQRIKNITNASGLNGNTLFPDYADPTVNATPLHKRNEEFQLMLTRFSAAYIDVTRFSDSAFYKYLFENQRLTNSLHNEYNNMVGTTRYTINDLIRDYDCVKYGLADIDIYGMGGTSTMYLTQKSNGPIPGSDTLPISDHYEIVPTNQCADTKPTPLVLSEAGITGALYVGGNPLPKDIQITRNYSEALNMRTLPGGTNINYPYLTDADFLQEKIIKTPYQVDNNNFFTYGISANEGGYLLPLTTRFFEYFNVNDMGTNNLSISMNEKDEHTIEVHLKIPVKFPNHPYIELVHTYYENDIVVMGGDPQLFTMAIFPSYKIMGGGVPNIYSVMEHDINDVLKTKFYRIGANQLSEVNSSTKVRRDGSGNTYETINEAFDICEVEWNGAKAMVIPQFKEVTPDQGGGETVVGIDFGTTNSYVSYSTKLGANPHSLEINREDLQVITLNKIDLTNGNYGPDYIGSMFMMPLFIQALDREYVPLLLGRQSDVAYPFRTVTCENNIFTNEAKPMLFGHISIGFNFMKEMIELENIFYKTNIKWDIESRNSTEPLAVKENRIRAFCEQTAWMIKSKIMLLHNPRTQFTVFLTFPYTMSRPIKNQIEGYWTKAFNKYMGTGNVQVERVTESIAPYYSMIANGVRFTKNALNIDIGGGTTDMLFADVEHQHFYYSSSLFAGNDIWGDGKKLVDMENKDNGFVADFEDKLNQGTLMVSAERKSGYERYKTMVKTSADLMSYVFRYEDEFKYVNYIRQSNEKLMPVLCIHLGALLYYVALVLKERQITMPSTITFSGMGAQYIRILCQNNDDVKFIVKSLLSEFMGYGINDSENRMPQDFNVSFQDNAKEVTARGAMLVNHASLAGIKNYDDDPICVHGIKLENEIQYENASDYKTNVLKVFNDFIDSYISNPTIINFFRDEFNINFNESIAEIIKNEEDQSFDLMVKEKNPKESVKESMFFWPLKNGLYEAAK